MTEHVHGTYAGYKTHKCRCDYCAAWMRVSKRVGDQKHLLDQIAAAARTGAHLPTSADNRRVLSVSTITRKQIKGQRDEAQQAVEDAHEARLRAVQKANRSIAALALLAVAEYTSDPSIALRYERAGLALAKEGE